MWLGNCNNKFLAYAASSGIADDYDSEMEEIMSKAERKHNLETGNKKGISFRNGLKEVSDICFDLL